MEKVLWHGTYDFHENYNTLNCNGNEICAGKLITYV